MTFWWQGGDLKQWTVTVTTSNVFPFGLQTFNLKQILNTNRTPGCKSCSSELLHTLTSKPSCQCLPKLRTPESEGFHKTEQSTALTVTDLAVVLTKMVQTKN